MNKKANGLSKLYYSVLTIAIDGTVSFATPVQIPRVKSITATDSYAEGEDYADNIRDVYENILTGAELDMTIANLERETEAAVTGKTYSKGEMVYKTTDIQPQVAILYQKTYNDNSYDNIIYYNCKMQKESDEAKSKTNNIEYSDSVLKGKVSPLPNGVVKYIISSDKVGSDTALKAKLDNFFTEVQFYGETA